MYNPCVACWNWYQKKYSEECDNECEYANAIAKLRPYGGIDEAVKVMRGEAVPIAMLSKENIDNICRIVYAAKEGII